MSSNFNVKIVPCVFVSLFSVKSLEAVEEKRHVNAVVNALVKLLDVPSSRVRFEIYIIIRILPLVYAKRS